jgi:hypothetical protein
MPSWRRFFFFFFFFCSGPFSELIAALGVGGRILFGLLRFFLSSLGWPHSPLKDLLMVVAENHSVSCVFLQLFPPHTWSRHRLVSSLLGWQGDALLYFYVDHFWTRPYKTWAMVHWLTSHLMVRMYRS